MVPKIIESDKIVFVDVDNTLVIWDTEYSETYKPHVKHIAKLKQFKERGFAIVVWSAGGHKWAHKVVAELKLHNYVDVICSKPDWFIDDLPADKFMPEHNRVFIKE